jgi:hypothetical protein
MSQDFERNVSLSRGGYLGERFSGYFKLKEASVDR